MCRVGDLEYFVQGLVLWFQSYIGVKKGFFMVPAFSHRKGHTE